jgi:hypothetical protein
LIIVAACIGAAGGVMAVTGDGDGCAGVGAVAVVGVVGVAGVELRSAMVKAAATTRLMRIRGRTITHNQPWLRFFTGGGLMLLPRLVSRLGPVGLV